MNSATENNITNKGDSDEWVTDEEENAFFRLSIENGSKIKNDINKYKIYHTKKIKRLEQDEINSANEVANYINKEILPTLSVKEDSISNLPYITIKNIELLVNEKPEIGTNLILEVNNDKKDIAVIGTSERVLEASVFRPRRRAVVKKEASKINRSSVNKKKIVKEVKKGEVKEEGEKKGNVIKGGMLKKKRKKPKRRYIKQSTIIEIKKLEN